MIRLFLIIICVVYLFNFSLTTKKLSDIFILDKSNYIRQFINIKGYIKIKNVRRTKSNISLAKFLVNEMELALHSLDYEKVYYARTHLLKLFKLGEKQGKISIIRIEFLYNKNIILESFPFVSFSFFSNNNNEKVRAFYKIQFKKLRE